MKHGLLLFILLCLINSCNTPTQQGSNIKFSKQAEKVLGDLKSGNKESAQLIQQLDNAKSDTAAINTLNHVIDNRWEYNLSDSLAILLTKEAFDKSKAINYNYGETEALLTFASIFIKNVPRADSLCWLSIDMGKKAGNKLLQARGWYLLGVIYATDPDGDNYSEEGNKKALDFLNKGLKLAKEADDKRIISRILFRIGMLTVDQSQQLDYFLQSLVLAEEVKDKQGQYDICQALSYLYKLQENFSMAINFAGECLSLLAARKDTVNMIPWYDELGTAYRSEGNYTKALECFTKVSELQEHLGAYNKWGRQYLEFNNIANLYAEQGNYAEAMKWFDKATAIDTGVNGNFRKVNDLAKLADAFNKKKDYNNAITYYKKAWQLSGSNGIVNNPQTVWLVVEVLTNLGMVYLQVGDYMLAKECCETALSLKTRDIAPGTYSLLTELAYRVCERQNEPARALQMYKLHMSLQDTIRNHENIRKFAEIDFNQKAALLKAQHEREEATAKAEIKQQRTILVATIAGAFILILSATVLFFFYRRKREAEVELEISTSKLMVVNAQLNYHFIFNMLSSIRAVVMDDQQEANQFITRFAKFLRTILNHSDLERISLKQELEELENYLQLEQLRYTNKFSYRFNISPDVDAEAVLVPPLIFQPVVENSIIHGFNGINYEGVISVNIKRSNGQLVCQVTDNGVGYQPKGDSKRKSFGTRLTRERLELFTRQYRQKAEFTIEPQQPGVLVTILLHLN